MTSTFSAGAPSRGRGEAFSQLAAAGVQPSTVIDTAKHEFLRRCANCSLCLCIAEDTRNEVHCLVPNFD
jgi:hypothetical protein